MPRSEPPLVRAALLAVALLFLALFLVVPLLAVFGQALQKRRRKVKAELWEDLARRGVQGSCPRRAAAMRVLSRQLLLPKRSWPAAIERAPAAFLSLFTHAR